MYRLSSRRQVLHLLRITIIVTLILGAASNMVYGGTAITDSSTPAGLAPGSPAGSYSLSGFDNLNLFSGHLDFHLPLLGIGRRGTAGYRMMLAVEQKWLVKEYRLPISTARLRLYLHGSSGTRV